MGDYILFTAAYVVLRLVIWAIWNSDLHDYDKERFNGWVFVGVIFVPLMFGLSLGTVVEKSWFLSTIGTVAILEALVWSSKRGVGLLFLLGAAYVILVFRLHTQALDGHEVAAIGRAMDYIIGAWLFIGTVKIALSRREVHA